MFHIWKLCGKILMLLSAPEPEAHVHYCDHALSVPSALLTFHIFNFFSSKTAEHDFNETWQELKQDFNVLYQVCVIWFDLKNKMAALASD